MDAGGRVFEWGVPRVWRKEGDMPGLAMSRSYGDLAAESVGGPRLGAMWHLVIE